MAMLRRVRSIPVGSDAREAIEQEAERRRRLDANRRRRYYTGTQYDDKNVDLANAEGLDDPAALPEHKKLLAYSTQIGECVDFLADRLGAGFTVEATAPAVQEVIDGIIASTEAIAAENDEGDTEIVTDDLIRDAAQTGDIACYVGWDPVEQRIYWEFWESEHVEFRLGDSATRPEAVIRTEVVWRTDDAGQYREVTERVEYTLQRNEAGIPEARADLYWDEDEQPRESDWLGIGRLPWGLLRIDKKQLRTFRGEPLITDQVMAHADRYNAVEQVSFLIARYNSHGNLVVVGDGAQLKAADDGRIRKDVADVLTFPGGTSATALTLPTDPQMIEHQRSVLSEAMYNVFGLTRVEPDTMQGLGGVTGYALEILNQKSEATYKRVARRWRKDMVSLIALSLDIVAWRRDAPLGLLDPETLAFTQAPEADLLALDGLMTATPSGVPMAAWWLVDPRLVFADRTVKIRMGSGYVVDEVMIRDDFVAGLISQEEALRQRGTEKEQIDKIVAETEAALARQAQAAANASAGSTFGSTRTTVPGAGSANGTKAGSTVGSTTSRR